MHDPVHRASGDDEGSGARVLSAVVQGDEAFFMGGGELGLLPAEPAHGLGNLHALESAGADEVGFEFDD